MRFSPEFIDELSSKVDILSLVEKYTSVIRSGSNYMAVCPFHREKTPSMCIYVSTNSFYCFGCHVGGDVISFFMKIENLDYHDAVIHLAEQVGLQISDDSQSYIKQKIVYSINRKSAQIYFNNLFSEKSKPCLNYLINRGLSIETIKHFQIGLSFGDRFSLCNILKKEFNEEDIVSSNVGVFSKNGNIYDRFVNRIIFPVFDLKGNIIAFGARSLDNKLPKYLNTSDTIVFKKSKNLFALNFARNNDYVILTEGYLDAISLHQIGFTSAIASLGTALNINQVKLISKYFKTVYVCYDSDKAGQIACKKAINMLSNENLIVKIIQLSGSKDPNEFVKLYGRDAKIKFQELIDSAIGTVEYKILNLKSNYNLNNTSDKVIFLKKVSQILSDIDDPVERDIYASKVCLKYKMSKNVFDLQINKCINLNSSCTSISRKNIEFFRGNSSNVEEFLLSSIILYGKFPDFLNELSRENFCNDIYFEIFETIKKISLEEKYISFNSVYSLILDSNVKNEFVRISNSKYVESVSLSDIKKASEILIRNSNFNKLKSSSDLDKDSLLYFLSKLKENKK